MDPDTWIPLKGALLAAGTARITGRPADLFIARSVAGPGAGGEGSVFISIDGRRVRLDLTSDGDILIDHLGDGAVRVTVRGEEYAGILERPALHCPGQAFITVTASCIFSCRYCSVPSLQGRRRTPEEIEAMVASVMGTISAIALTSGVLERSMSAGSSPVSPGSLFPSVSPSIRGQRPAAGCIRPEQSKSSTISRQQPLPSLQRCAPVFLTAPSGRSCGMLSAYSEEGMSSPM